jgi:hypothetical protein
VTNLQKMLSEDLHNGAEGLRQRIRKDVALLTIEEIRNSFKQLRNRVESCAENGAELIE